jgi:HSP90 family molecular chaperone
MEYLPVTVDKSHLITIGERLYSESIELIRELVNNAYDADATEVDIRMTDDSIEVKDNGVGMDREGLRQYFNIGSPEKVLKNRSPIFHRDLVGQFGIGKFASLAACECFEVHTQKGDFAAKVTFDKREWERKETGGICRSKPCLPIGKEGMEPRLFFSVSRESLNLKKLSGKL